MNFSYVNPTKIFFGQKQIAAIKEAIPSDQKVLVVYGGGSIKKNGVYDQVSEALEGHEWLEFSGVEPNPTKETLDKAVAMVKEHGVDFILAVGGGSVIDGSKYVAAASKYDGDGWDIMIGKHQVTEATPLAAILTLPATGSESNMGAVITKKETQDKLPFMSPAVQPKFAVLDPDVMKTLPERQLINGIVDAWVHVCEQYLTLPTGAMVQDGYAETLLKTLKTLGEQFAERDDDMWRANLMWSANQALNGLIGSGVPQDWATHMIGHELTALWGVDHARSLAIVQPSLLRNQMRFKRPKLEQMGRNVFGLEAGDDLAERTIEAIEAFYHQLDVATKLENYGESREQAIDAIIEQLNKHGMTVLGENQAITLERSREILELAVA
ncbi:MULTISPECIES: iron-containing alcohol dehydrogenase [Vibrio diabolicus subgroup]|uniref:iron-containing alcohol dehydrogenase n=1 Tax=Vibrio diabolicus subgroup TaxID=2315253 RepID=UPI0021607265|nr:MULTISPECIES: iron-containing alcohol dehydrogenase [Vibrio diabolicus subgroup]MCR9548656.1 iron-containing alcohol dehydrogenase [Vibrio antiquarius]MCS0346515.1 iron-containing alcohol dehydrogenase [Vibrio diabolicus]MCS0361630.1 iron-containing alcohol dehydrogenase [Vibrio diabolicus]MCS0376300.1 iron-containing alcohol dehydrogenase [Vibrio diabolicus]MCS0427483.1 iron-containing alcohol dehydrogenase [Vibrio diabolicus]